MFILCICWDHSLGKNHEPLPPKKKEQKEVKIKKEWPEKTGEMRWGVGGGGWQWREQEGSGRDKEEGERLTEGEGHRYRGRGRRRGNREKRAAATRSWR